MNKPSRPWKILPIWLAVTAVVLIAGIIVMALFGFNTSADRPETSTFEAKYNIVVINNDALREKLDGICEETFAANELSYSVKQTGEGTGEGQDINSTLYTFEDLTDATRAKVENEVKAKIAADGELSGDYVYVHVAWHEETLRSGYDMLWRGAVAVGIVVALVYVGIRFGLGCALTGLTLAVHDALAVLCLVSICRIPVYASAPVLYALIAALLSIVMWLIFCMKLRAVVKGTEGRSLDAEEAVLEAHKGAWKQIVLCSALVAVLFAAMSAASLGVMALTLPMLLCVATALYSSLLLGPSLHVYVKRAFDKRSRKNRGRYVGKQKQEVAE